jgi:PST family polysaccharide transporter
MNTKLSALYENGVQTLRLGLRSAVARNAASLYLIQFANYIVPLIMVPYLVRVLGPAGYGAVAFARGFVNYLMLFVEYGFDWSATRKISVHRDDPQVVSHTVVHVWAAKGVLFLAGFGLLLLLIILVPKLREVAWLLLMLYGLVLGNVLFPTWLFQGMERMVAIAFINLAMKVAILAGVFLLVRRPEDAVVYAGLMGGGAVAAGLTGMVVAIRMFGLRPTGVSWAGIRETLREGWVLFLSKASVSLYTAGNAFILGMLTNHMVVGYYSAAEKMVLAISGLMSPISQAVYPRMSKLASTSKTDMLFVGRRTLVLMGGIGLALTVSLLVASPLVVKFILGGQYMRSLDVIRILAPWIFINGVTNVWGIQVMIPFGYDRAFFLILLLAGLINIILAIPLAAAFQEIGMAISVLLSCTFVTVAQPVFLYSKAKISPWLGLKTKAGSAQ